MNVQKMVPFSHSEWLFALNSPPSAALPDIFMTTLCRLWALRLSRTCPVCTPCEARCQAQPLTDRNTELKIFEFALRVLISCWFFYSSRVFRMLRGASMMQDFPILTWTNNLESLWVNLDAASFSALLCFRSDLSGFSYSGPCREPKYHPCPLICARTSKCSERCEKLFLSCCLYSSS